MLSLRLFTLLLVFSSFACQTALAEVPEHISTELREECIQTLRDVMNSGEEPANLKAAEYLVKLSYPEGVSEFVELKLKSLDANADRNEVLRVAYIAAPNKTKRKELTEKIQEIFLKDPSAQNAQLLAVLKIPLKKEIEKKLLELSESNDPESRLGAIAALATCPNKHQAENRKALLGLLESDNPQTLQFILEIMTLLADVNSEEWNDFFTRFEKEKDEAVRLSLAGVLLNNANGKSSEQIESLHQAVVSQLESNDPEILMEANRVLGVTANESDLELLTDMVREKQAAPEVRAAAANAILRYDRRVPHPMHTLDWTVLGVYAVLMLYVGWYYSRGEKTSEEYMLGGRNMRPWMVGLSFFATLMSTNSYLAFPGEMIKHGPLILAAIVGFPFAYYIIGWFLIPAIMRMNVTSGYEILEMKLGLTSRLMGALIFLILRVMWMGMIIYGIVHAAVLPMTGLSEDYAAIISILLAGLTIIYTSMGGLRAVFMTDVIQTFILFGGALLTVVLIANHFGSFGAIFPKEWADQWAPLKYNFTFGADRTVAIIALNYFAWYVCTSGSDQMAIQRFLATKDVKAARRTLGTSMLANAVVTLFLGIVGLALMAYFYHQPQRLPDAVTVQSGADKLFARYMLIGLPIGITGLVASGLFAAAMSSLSSGMNSSSAVLSEDFIDRFVGKAKSDQANVRRAQWLSVLVGIVSVLLSFLVGMVPGNLLEIVSRMSNVLVAPLFILFFMSLFIPFATEVGSIFGMLLSTISAVLIAFVYGDVFGVFWIISIPMLIGIVTGTLASALTQKLKPNETGTS